ncbi:putative reverse transcriptase domain-containing protein [Tanacetum coccineum]
MIAKSMTKLLSERIKFRLEKRKRSFPIVKRSVDNPSSSTPVDSLDDINSVHHPLYFHPHDHPGMILISKKLSGSENYSTWKRSMMIALSARNKLKLVTGEFEEPEMDSPLRSFWERANDMVISWILNTVTDQISNNLNFVNTAHSLWHQLYDHYSQLDGHRIYQLSNEIVHLKQLNCSVEVYYHKLKGLWDELDALEAPYSCTCKCVCENGKTNGERDHRKRLIQFLMGLDENYTNIRGQILLMQPLPIVAKAYSMLRQEEKQREAPKQTTSSVPFALNTYRNTHESFRNGRNQNSYHNSQHQSQAQPQAQTQVQGRRSAFKVGVICGNCNKEGHTKEECYKLVGYPVGHPMHNKLPPQRRQFNSSQNRPRTVNMTMMNEGEPVETSPVDTNMVNLPADYSVTARMDQLQNQINQVILMMQNNTEASPCGSHNFMAVAQLIIFAHQTTEKIVLIKQRMQAAQDRQKSYADRKRKPMEFEVGDRVMLKVSPWKGVVRFGKRGKLNPRYVGPFKVLAKVGKVAYRLELPQELSRVHHTFHVSNLKKCYADEPLVMPLEGIHVDDKLQFVEEPVEIMEREIKRLKRSRIPLVKVRWNSRRGPEFTWEREDSFKQKYPQLFTNRASSSTTRS